MDMHQGSARVLRFDVVEGGRIGGPLNPLTMLD